MPPKPSTLPDRPTHCLCCGRLLVIAAAGLGLVFARGASRGWSANQGLENLWWTAFPSAARDTLQWHTHNYGDRQPPGAGVTVWTSASLDLLSVGVAAGSKPPVIRTSRANCNNRSYQLVPGDAFCDGNAHNVYHLLYDVVLPILGAAAEGNIERPQLVIPAAAGTMTFAGELELRCHAGRPYPRRVDNFRQILFAGLGINRTGAFVAASESSTWPQETRFLCARTLVTGKMRDALPLIWWHRGRMKVAEHAVLAAALRTMASNLRNAASVLRRSTDGHPRISWWGRGNGSRSVVNSDAVVDAVSRWFNTSVVKHHRDPAALPVADQIAAFVEADVIIAPHGAGLALIPAMTEGSVVVELWSSSWYHYELFANIAALSGVSLTAVRCDGVKPAGHSSNNKQASDDQMRCGPQNVVKHVAEAVRLWAQKPL